MLRFENLNSDEQAQALKQAALMLEADQRTVGQIADVARAAYYPESEDIIIFLSSPGLEALTVRERLGRALNELTLDDMRSIRNQLMEQAKAGDPDAVRAFTQLLHQAFGPAPPREATSFISAYDDNEQEPDDNGDNHHPLGDESDPRGG